MSPVGAVLLAAVVGWVCWRLGSQTERTRRASRDVKGAKGTLKVARRVFWRELAALARASALPAVVVAAVYLLYLIGRD